MTAIFPFGFSLPTAFYLTLYVLTFVLHQMFMHYVLAGSLYVAWAAAWPGQGSRPRTEQTLSAVLRDWMPFLLSAAITVGVAPLLFIQIVYQRQFYTANLLLWWRWMMVVPVLIGAFYLLYLIKSSWLWRWPYGVRVAVAAGTSICFLFVGFCWTANHLLANSGADWPEVYATGRLPFSAGAVIPRMLVWIGGSFATMSAIVGWQLFYRQTWSEAGAVESPEQRADLRTSVRTLASLTGGGLTIAVLAGLLSIVLGGASSRSLLWSGLILPYLCLTVAGLVLQGIGWRWQWQASRFDIRGLMAATAGAVCSVLGVAVIREGVRLRAVDLVSLAPQHAQAATVGGFGVFIAAALLVSILIAWCVRLVKVSWSPQVNK